MATAHVLLLGALLLTSATAHMQLTYPAPFNASNNPHRTTAADPYLQYPYDCCGPNDRWVYPCRGYHSLLGTPQGAPTSTWAPGSQQKWSIAGIGNHFGGSCQVGFSVDKGETFHVTTSYEGNCPHRNSGDGPEGQSFNFTVPQDLQPGVQLFGWMWYNRERELNMNCAAVNITAATAPFPTSASTSYGLSPTATADTSSGTSAEPTDTPAPTYKTANGLTCTCTNPSDISTCDCACPGQINKRSDNHASHLVKHAHAERAPAAAIAFSSRPIMFVADDGNGCLTPKTTAELKYPDPGPDVVAGDGIYPLELPSGDCEGVGRQAYEG